MSIFADAGRPRGANSLRAAAAARAAAEHGKFVEYSDILFDNQPSTRQQGYAVDDLIAWGEEGRHHRSRLRGARAFRKRDRGGVRHELLP